MITAEQARLTFILATTPQLKLLCNLVRFQHQDILPEVHSIICAIPRCTVHVIGMTPGDKKCGIYACSHSKAIKLQHM